jgi:YidC/Oxa1 family membrane protein insertase
MAQTSSGGFDRKTLLAFALMIIVWIVFTQFFMPKPKPRAAAPATAASETARAVPAARDTAGSAGSEMIAGDDLGAGGPGVEWRIQNTLAADERDVVVEGDHYRAVFSARGAQLRSWKLTDYTDARKQTVDLIAPGSGALQLRLEGPDGTVALDRTLFSVEASEPDAGGTRTLRFVAEGPLVRSDAPADSGGGTGTGRAVRVERVYRLGRERYDFEMQIVVDGIENPRQDKQIVLAWEDGIPNLETQRALETRAKASVAQLAAEFIHDGYGGSGIGCQCRGGRASRGGERSYQGTLRWAGVRGKYFAGLLVPAEEHPATYIACSDPVTSRAGMRLVMPLAFDGRTEQRYTVFAGPIDYPVLKELDGRLHRDIPRLVDYGGKLIAPISKATHWFLMTVHKVVPNYGLVIIVLALVVRLLFHPLNVKALQSQRKLQALKPLLDEINLKYKDNAELRTKKTMELHKIHGVNPLGGCLPLLVQMPVIYALYNVLMNAIELRKAPFAFWMTDLSAPDTVGHAFGMPINILPLLMAGTMFWQQKLTPSDPRQAPMLIMMPLLMVFFFYGLPSGLVLYWTVTNVLAVVQQMRMKPLVLATPDGGPGNGKETALFGAKRTQQA